MEKLEIEEGKKEQEVWSWGAGTDGQLATVRLQDEHLPQFITSLPSLRISSIACGGAHALALLQGGIVVAWGRGKSGQLGVGSFENSIHPIQVKSLQNLCIHNIAAGWGHSAFVSDGGDLFTCGDGTFGQLGHGDYESQCLPVKVKSLATKSVSMVSCGMRHTLVLLKDTPDSVYAFGSARHGQLGFASTESKQSVTDTKKKETKYINLPKCVEVLNMENIRFVCANGEHSAALTENGYLYLWGRGFAGTSDIRSPTLLTRNVKFTQVALGWNHCLALAETGEVYMVGGCHHGKLDILQDENDVSLRSLEIHSDIQGEDSDCIHLQMINLIQGRRIKQIACGAEHSAVVTEDEVLMTWGWGEHGQLGLGTTNDWQNPQIVSFPSHSRTEAIGSTVYCGSGFTFLVRHLA